MKLAYIAGPYTADTPEQINANVTAAIDVQAKLMARGCAVFCPHANYGHGLAAVDYDAVMAMCFTHLENADVVVLLPGWKKSQGACREHGFAAALHKRVFSWASEQEALELYLREGD